jgi:hypothetical protein
MAVVERRKLSGQPSYHPASSQRAPVRARGRRSNQRGPVLPSQTGLRVMGAVVVAVVVGVVVATVVVIGAAVGAGAVEALMALAVPVTAEKCSGDGAGTTLCQWSQDCKFSMKLLCNTAHH